MKAVLVLGGAPPPPAAWLECRDAYVVAADSGAALCEKAGVVPDLVLGDMDSVPADVLDRLAAKGTLVKRFPRAKDETDGRLALDAALAKRPTEVVFLASLGRRLDHTLANLQLLRRAAEAGAAARAVEALGRVWCVGPGRALDVEFAKGAVVSVLPLTERAEGVRLEGLAWKLDGATLLASDPVGVSNEATGGRVRVACASGVLAVIAPPV